MSEKLTTHHDKHERLDIEAISRENLKRVHEKAAEMRKQGDQAPSIERARHKAHEQAVSGQEYSVAEHDASPSNQSHTFGTHQQLKADSYTKTLRRVQNHLKGPEKSFSKVIHSKPVDKASSIGAQTVARPLGILVGGLVACVGSVVVLYMAKHYGFKYNFSLFIILFIGGYVLGTVLEGLGKLLKRS